MFVYPFHYVFSGRLSLGSFIAILLIYLFISMFFYSYWNYSNYFYLFFMAQAGVLSSRKDDEGKKRKVNVP